MSDRCILAIDQGTTGTTVLVVGDDGAPRARAYAEITQHYPRPGWVEHDADEIWRLTLGVIADALTAAGIAAEHVHAIGITNQRETVVLWDRATGNPLGRAIVWQDRRTADACDALKERGLEATVRAKTGLVIDPYFSASKIAWRLEADPSLRRRAEQGEIAAGTIDSWLLWRLTGGRVHATDVSNASRTLLFNIHTLIWDEALLALFGVPMAMLPEVRPTAGLFGETAAASFFGVAGVPIACLVGDQQAALFGHGCVRPGQAKNTYGTGSFVVMNTGGTVLAGGARLLTTVAWRIGDAPVVYALEGAIFTTGAAVQWLRDGLGIIARADEAEALARSLDGNDGVYFVPALAGLGAPYWDAYARGALIGLTGGSGRAHLARAVLESIAYRTRDVVAAMGEDSGLRLSELRADGGASANGFLMQFQADLLGVPVIVPRYADRTALGAARLAGRATGFWRDDDAGDAAAIARRYTPAMDAATRERLYARWRRAVARARDWARDENA